MVRIYFDKIIIKFILRLFFHHNDIAAKYAMLGYMPAKSNEHAQQKVIIIGVATALCLQRHGFDVVIVDKKEPGEGASFGNGGVLAAMAMVPVTVPGLIKKAPKMLLDRQSPLFLKWTYLPKLAPWLCRYLSHANSDDMLRISKAIAPLVVDSISEHQVLAESAEARRWIVPSDYIYLYDNQAQFYGDSFIWSIRKSYGFHWQLLDAMAFKKYDRHFAPDFNCVVKLKHFAIIADPGQYVKALAKQLVDNGGKFIKGNYQGASIDVGRIRHVSIDNQQVDCQFLVLATGAWSKTLLKPWGISVPLESERGYHVDLWSPSVVPRAPTMVTAAKFVMTPMQGRLRLAGIVEFGGLKALPSKSPIELLKTRARAAMPGLTWQKETEWMGHRPAPADSIPIIGALPASDWVYVAFGHHHIGLTAAAKTGRLLADLIANGRAEIDLSVYSPARFSV